MNCSPYLAWLCHSPFSFTVSPGLKPGMLPTIVTRPVHPFRLKPGDGVARLLVAVGDPFYLSLQLGHLSLMHLTIVYSERDLT